MSLCRSVVGALVALSTVVGAVSVSQAQTVTASITVDNVYGLYWGTPSALTLVGTDRNWDTAENYSFAAAAGSFVYVAGWDQGGGQGFQGVVSGAGGTFRSNLTDFVATVIPASALPGWSTAGVAVPPIASLQTALATAVWQPVLASRPHGAAPWGGVIADPATLWVWKDDIDGGTTDGSLVVYRTASAVVTAVPEPSSALMMLMGTGLMGFLYRRRVHASSEA